MRGNHPERISGAQARPTARLTLTPPCLSHSLPARSLSERHRHDPLLAVSLEEGPMGAPSPCVPPRGSWRTPAAAPVKRRSRSLARRRTALTNIGRSPHIPWRAVIGGQGLSTLSGLASRASRPSLGRGARPSFLRPRRGVAEPRHASSPPLTPLPRQMPSRISQGASLGQGGIPMSQIALAVGTAPARRLKRPAADGCGSIKSLPEGGEGRHTPWPCQARGGVPLARRATNFQPTAA